MRTCIFGLGYVGCVSLGNPARNGHEIVGVDVSQSKVDMINSAQATILEDRITFRK